jgi:predicted amidohydrolase
MRIALAQYALSANLEDNLSKALRLMHEAGRQGAQLVVFPELCLSPFFPQYPARDTSMYAVNLGDECIEQFQNTCRRFGLVASPNVYLQEGSRRFDASLLITADGEIQGVSKMVHIAQVPGFYEQDYYTPSDTGFKVYQQPFGRLGIVVCFDRHYPESVRTCTLRGAQLIVIPTANTKTEPTDLFECELRAAAMQNGVFIAMCNRVGKEGDAEFCGESIVVNSDGNVAFKANDSEGLFVVDVDLAQIEMSRSRRPYLSLRRPQTYER